MESQLWRGGVRTKTMGNGSVTTFSNILVADVSINQQTQHGDFKRGTPYLLLVDQQSRLLGFQSRLIQPANPNSYYEIGAFGIAPPSLISEGVSDAAAYASCLTSVYNQLRGNLDIAVDIAEWRQTHKMITTLETFTSTARLFAAVKKSLFQGNLDLKGYGSMFSADDFVLANDNSKRARGQLKFEALRSAKNAKQISKLSAMSASDLYLAWKFGAEPLISDVYETVKLMHEKIIPEKVHLRKQRSFPWPRSIKVATPIAATIPGDKGGTAKLASGSKTGCNIKLVFKADMALPDLAKFTSLNPLSIAWEATPSSFLLDWWLDIGNFLRLIENNYLYRSSISDITVTALRAYSAQYDYNNETQSGSSLYRAIYRGNRKQVQIRRTKPTSLPNPIRPKVSVDLSSGKMLTLAALAVRLLK